MTKRSVPLEAARIKAEALLHYLEPVCDKIAIAGSIRRNKPTVGDIEIVAVPTIYKPENQDLFGNTVGKPFDRLDEVIDEAAKREGHEGFPWLKRLNNGKKYLKLHDQYLDIQIDLFVVRPPAEWGPIFAIRTGPAKFSQRLVTGLHVRKLQCKDGRVVEKKTGKHVRCPTEKRFFRLCGLRWKEPEDRK